MSNRISSSSSAVSGNDGVVVPSLMQDLMVLTKFRLSVLVIVTTFVGFWLRKEGGEWGWLLVHTLVGSTLAAFGAGIFNQLMEIEPDGLMARTADRPLPAGRISPVAAFGLAWLMSSLALIHLTAKVNVESAVVTGLTLGVYIFVYTPLKRVAEANTLVGAISGALPPLIGWAGAVGANGLGDGVANFRWWLFVEPGAIFLFGLMFLWQLPHFLAINWMYRDEYLRGGFVMLANEDVTGVRTSRHALMYSVGMFGMMGYVMWTGAVESWWFGVPAVVMTVWLCTLAWQFVCEPERGRARKLFFCTLGYLPVLLLVTCLAWRRN
jgi:heme o synthase